MERIVYYRLQGTDAATMVPPVRRTDANVGRELRNMTEETVTIILPLPHRCLSPNQPPASHGSRMRKAAETKRYRRLAKYTTIAEGVESGPWERATIQAHFVHKVDRRRDDVNSLQMLKPAYDGVVDAGLLVDDDSKHLTTLPATFSIDKESPRVELTFTRKD